MTSYKKTAKKTYENRRPMRLLRKGTLKRRQETSQQPIPEIKENMDLRLKGLDYAVNVAKKNLEMELYVPAAFYIHLAVEKALKAAIVALNGEFPEKTHRLQRLYEKIADQVPLTPEQVEFLEKLTPVVSRARYDDMELVDPTEIYTKEVAYDYMQKALPIIEKLKANIQEK